MCDDETKDITYAKNIGNNIIKKCSAELSDCFGPIKTVHHELINGTMYKNIDHFENLVNAPVSQNDNISDDELCDTMDK